MVAQVVQVRVTMKTNTRIAVIAFATALSAVGFEQILSILDVLTGQYAISDATSIVGALCGNQNLHRIRFLVANAGTNDDATARLATEALAALDAEIAAL